MLRTKTRYFHFSSPLTVSNPAPLGTIGRPGSHVIGFAVAGREEEEAGSKMRKR